MIMLICDFLLYICMASCGWFVYGGNGLGTVHMLIMYCVCRVLCFGFVC